jgi:hypothetical protein
MPCSDHSIKRGELIILWVGGLLSVFVLIEGARVEEPFIIGVFLLAIWIICGLVWLTLYRRQ